MRAGAVVSWMGALVASACASCHSGATGGGSPAATSAERALASSTVAVTASDAASTLAVPLPATNGGIGFDDLGFAPGLRKVLAPAAGTGNLDLVDPASHAVTIIGGFSAAAGAYKGGHDDGVTSADEGRGLLFAADRTSQKLDVVDPAARRIVASVKLGGSPDYVRWVDATGELWVTEPDREAIEVFRVPQGPSPTPAHAANIAVKGGPESLAVDPVRRKAFAHLWKGSSVAIDLATHAVVATWPNGCEGSRGIALDTQHGFLFAGCAEGALAVLDVDHDGEVLGSARSGSGVDVIAYSPALGHAYLPGAKSATMAIVGIAANGQPSVLGTVPTANGAHCVTADDRAEAWVCDPFHGQLLLVRDTYPASAAASTPR